MFNKDKDIEKDIKDGMLDLEKRVKDLKTVFQALMLNKNPQKALKESEEELQRLIDEIKRKIKVAQGTGLDVISEDDIKQQDNGITKLINEVNELKELPLAKQYPQIFSKITEFLQVADEYQKMFKDQLLWLKNKPEVMQKLKKYLKSFRKMNERITKLEDQLTKLKEGKASKKLVKQIKKLINRCEEEYSNESIKENVGKLVKEYSLNKVKAEHAENAIRNQLRALEKHKENLEQYANPAAKSEKKPKVIAKEEPKVIAKEEPQIEKEKPQVIEKEEPEDKKKPEEIIIVEDTEEEKGDNTAYVNQQQYGNGAICEEEGKVPAGAANTNNQDKIITVTMPEIDLQAQKTWGKKLKDAFKWFWNKICEGVQCLLGCWCRKRTKVEEGNQQIKQEEKKDSNPSQTGTNVNETKNENKIFEVPEKAPGFTLTKTKENTDPQNGCGADPRLLRIFNTDPNEINYEEDEIFASEQERKEYQHRKSVEKYNRLAKKYNVELEFEGNKDDVVNKTRNLKNIAEQFRDNAKGTNGFGQ